MQYRDCDACTTFQLYSHSLQLPQSELQTNSDARSIKNTLLSFHSSPTNYIPLKDIPLMARPLTRTYAIANLEETPFVPAIAQKKTKRTWNADETESEGAKDKVAEEPPQELSD